MRHAPGKNAEHETLWAAIAPKLVRLDALLDTPANAPLGGQSGISGQTESVGQKQTAKRVSSLWAKDHVRRWYAVARIMPEVSEHRLFEMAGQGAVVNAAVHKMMNNFAAWRIGAFETQRVEKSAIMFTNDRFAALVRCIEAFIEAAGGNQALEAAHDFLRGFRDLSADLNTYTSKHRSAFQNKGTAGPGSMMASQLERAINDDFAAITKAVGGVATELKNSYRDEPPRDDDVLPAVSPVEFAKTRAAINDITGVHSMAEMMRAMGKSGGAGGNFGGGTSGGGSAAKKQKTTSSTAPFITTGGERTAPQKASTVAALRASGCPFGTCRFYWDSGTCNAAACPFNHDQTKAAAGVAAGEGATGNEGAAGKGKRTVRFGFGSGGGFPTQQRDGSYDREGGGGLGSGGFTGGGGSSGGGMRRG